MVGIAGFGLRIFVYEESLWSAGIGYALSSGFTTETRRARRLTENIWGKQYTHVVLAVLRESPFFSVSPW
jgi:hypothetical protein